MLPESECRLHAALVVESEGLDDEQKAAIGETVFAALDLVAEHLTGKLQASLREGQEVRVVADADDWPARRWPGWPNKEKKR